ncbi:MAG TPA: anion transporter [Dehalococcoidia bacterium]|nr:anion transporter [Dehalococcoidia bacterium]
MASTAALIIFVLTFAGVALTRLPWVRLDRPAAAFLGAVAMVLFGVMTPFQAVGAINWDTISLLLGMMVIIAGLQHDGYVQTLAMAVLGKARSAPQLLVAVIGFTGLASAFLVNDAVVLVLTPILVTCCRARGVNPVPFLLAEAMASNIGGAATITGNPQNMLIGLQTGISYGGFLLRLLPVAVAGSLVLGGCTWWVYRRELRQRFAPVIDGPDRTQPWLRFRPSGVILVLVVLGFMASRWTGVEVPLVALAGAALVLALSGRSPGELFIRVDWVLLLFFAGLFVVIGGAVGTGLLDQVIDAAPVTGDFLGVVMLHGLSLGLSQLISNVPYTVLITPVLQAQHSDLLWLSLASAATLAGNLTLIGAVSNLIVAEGAAQEGVRITFGEFFNLGLPVTALSMGVSLLVLWVESALGLLV